MRRAGLALAVALLAGWSLAPFLWSVVTSLKAPREVFAVPPTYLPHEWSVESYAAVFRQRPFARYLANSLLVAFVSTGIALVAGSLAAYALARLRVRGAAAFEAGLLVAALLPPAVLLAPLYSSARALGLVNSHLALAAVHAALNLPFAVWMLAAFFRQLPPDLEDAARVDGFSRPGFLVRILLPLSAPALASTGLVVFIFSWNEFLIALAFMTRDGMRTVPVGIAMLSGATAYEVPWGQISAAVVMTTLPVVAAALLFQRWILAGLTAGAVKG